jgi:hypothetical protein
MKYVCDACERLVEPRGTSGEAPLALICSRCGEPTQVLGRAPIRLIRPVSDATSPSAATTSAPGADEEVDLSDETAPAPIPIEARCPKCTHPRSGPACPKCGLVFALYRPEKGGELERVAEELAQLLNLGPTGWTKRLALVGPEQLTKLARACRLRLAEAPADATARALLDDISSRSLAQVMALAPSKRTEESSSERGRLIAYGAVALGLLTIASLVAYTLGNVLH